MKIVNEFYVLLMELNDWVFVYETSGCGIDSRCRYLKVRYCAWFEQRAPWHLDNCRVYTHAKTRMWHGKNTQLKTFLPLRTVLLHYFIYSRVLRHLRFYMVKQFQLRLAGIGTKHYYSFDQKNFSCLSSYLLPIHKKNHAHLANWFTMLKKYFCLHLSQSEHQ